MTKPATELADFLTAAKALLPTRKMDVGGMTIVIRGLSVRQLEQCNTKATRKPASKSQPADIDGEKLTEILLGQSLYDLDGNRLIPEDREAEIFDLPNDIIKKLSDAVFELNGLRNPEPAEGNG